MARSNPVELSVVLPAYQEGPAVIPVLRSLIENMPPISWEAVVVVDSPDDTTVAPVQEVSRDNPQVRVELNRRGRGALNAMLSGFDVARGTYVLVTMSDGSDDYRDLPAMWSKAAAGAQLVAGSRYVRGGRQLGGPLIKRTMSRMAGLSLHWLGGVAVHDATSNYRLYSRELLDRVVIESKGGFELGIELTVKAHRMGMQLAEVPTTWRDRTAGTSNFRLLEWLPSYLRWYFVGLAARVDRRPQPAE